MKSVCTQVFESYKAAADLSAAQYHFVKAGTNEGEVVLYNGTGIPLGILQNAPESGELATVVVSGGSKVVCGSGLTAGAPVKPDSSGHAAAPATQGDLIFAIMDAIGQTSTAGDILACIVGKFGYYLQSSLKEATYIGIFDPSANAGERTVAAHDILDENGNALSIPDNFVCMQATYDVITTFTSATDSATIAIALNGANDVVTATAISAGGNVWDAGLHAGVPVSTAATAIKTTAVRTPTATVAVDVLTAGKLVIEFRGWQSV